MARPKKSEITIATPERILAAAEEAFAEHGHAGAKLADIARAAGLRRPSLLYHFKSKDVLYAAVVGQSFSRMAAAMLTARSTSGSFEEQLHAVADAFTGFLAAQPRVARIIVRELLDDGGPGAQLMASQAAPLLDETERWIREQGHHQLRTDLDVRVVMMHIASDAILRHAAGALREPLWGSKREDRSWQIATTMLLSEED